MTILKTIITTSVIQVVHLITMNKHPSVAVPACLTTASAVPVTSVDLAKSKENQYELVVSAVSA